jgi:hypothetical protein
MSNMRRFQDPNDEWTRLVLFGSIRANNVGRSEDKAAKRQAMGDITNRAPSRPASDTSSSIWDVHCPCPDKLSPTVFLILSSFRGRELGVRV